MIFSIPSAILILMTYEPLISYETLHMLVLAMLMTCFAIPIGSLLWSWIVRLTKLDHDKIIVPSHDFGPEEDHIRIIDTDRQPYDWAKEID